MSEAVVYVRVQAVALASLWTFSAIRVAATGEIGWIVCVVWMTVLMVGLPLVIHNYGKHDQIGTGCDG